MGFKKQHKNKDRQEDEHNPFGDICFWFRLATLDYCGSFGITGKNDVEQENT